MAWPTAPTTGLSSTLGRRDVALTHDIDRRRGLDAGTSYVFEVAALNTVGAPTVVVVAVSGHRRGRFCTAGSGSDDNAPRAAA